MEENNYFIIQESFCKRMNTFFIRYINYANSIGHNYIKIDWNEQITQIWTRKPIISGSGAVFSVDQIKYTVSQKSFQKDYLIYNCTQCNTTLIYDDCKDFKELIISKKSLILSKEKINMKKFFKLNNPLIPSEEYFDFKPYLISENYYLSCNEMQIKNLLE